MKNLIALFTLCVFFINCSNVDIADFQPESEIETKKIENTNSKTKTNEQKRGTSEVLCGLGFFINGDFDGDYMIGETVLIQWDVTLCGSTTPLPNKISLVFKEKNGFPVYRLIVQDISPTFKSDPSNNATGNFLWTVDDFTLVDGEDYEMIMQNEDNGNLIDITDFTITGTVNPQNCDFSVSNELDGDYNIEFTINNNECLTNVQYDVDFGDGQNSSIVNNNNIFSFSHQYPFGTYANYSITITKKDITSGNVLSTQIITVTAKRD